jgi:hypothetical protein
MIDSAWSVGWDVGVVVDRLAIAGVGGSRTGAGGEGEAATAGPAASATIHRTAATRARARRDRCMALIVRHASRSRAPDDSQAPVLFQDDLRGPRPPVVGR